MVVPVVAVEDILEHAESRVHLDKEMMVVLPLVQVMAEVAVREREAEMEILLPAMERHVGLVV
jgi:hypothetical protein